MAVVWKPLIENVGVALPLGGSGRGTPMRATMSLAEMSVLVRIRRSLAPTRNEQSSDRIRCLILSVSEDSEPLPQY